MKKKSLLVLMLALAVFATACASTASDEIGLIYNDGPIQGQSYDKMVDPGSGQVFMGPFDFMAKLPVNQRDYTFCPDDGCDAPPIKVTALGGAELAFSGGVTFELNTGTEEMAREFYEEICRKFDCTTDEGWDEMLRVNMRGPIEDALQEEVRGYSVDALYAGVPAEGEAASDEEALSTLTKVSDALAATLKETINQYAGGDYFCGPAYDRSKPDECPDFEFIITEVTPSDAVRAAFDQNVASRQGVIDAKNKADAAEIEAQGQKRAQDALAGLYTDPNYISYLRALAEQECAKNANCTLIIGGDNTGVNVTPRQPG